jgi:ribosomal protein S18 acetylase RimI-like enzyme
MPYEYTIRPARVGDVAFLHRMLYGAAYWRSGDRKPPTTEMLADDHLLRYVSGWGRAGDVGMIAENENTQPLGAAWFRLLSADNSGYGFIDESIPEVSIAVLGDCRGQGIGTALLTTLLEEAAGAGFQALCLSVSADNPALHLYEKLGFAKVKLVEGSWTMICRIRDLN